MITSVKKDPLLPLLAFFGDTELPEIPSRMTEECFSRPRAHRAHSDRLRLLPIIQPKTKPCVVTTLVPKKDASFAEWAGTIVGAGTSTDIVLLAKLLKERGYTMTFPQAERMVKVTESKLNGSARTESLNIFFFVKNKKTDVSVVRFYYYGPCQGFPGIPVLEILQLENNHSRRANKYLFVPNLNTASPVF